jgi:hypothetical protein
LSVRRLFLILFWTGIIGFVGAFFLPRVGARLAHVELPAFFETTTIRLPDGGFLRATLPTQRLQRYDRDGHFIAGWFVEAAGGHFMTGLTTDGNVAICTARGRHLDVYDLDGTRVGGRRACTARSQVGRYVLWPSDFDAAEISLRAVAVVAPQHPSIASLVWVPLWHPLVAWLMAVVGALGLKRLSSPS